MRKSVLLFIICLTMLLSGCNSLAKYDNTEEEIDYVNLIDDISAEAFEEYSHVYIHGENIESFMNFYDSNTDVVDDFLVSNGKLIISLENVNRTDIENRLKTAVYETASDVDTESIETIATIYYMQDDILCSHDICVSKGMDYDRTELIQLTIDKIFHKDDWKDVETNGPIYVGTKGYTFFDEVKADVSMQYDVYTIQDSLGFDEYYVIENVQGNTENDGMELYCALDTPTTGMFYIESQPQPQSQELEKVYLSNASIVWEQDSSNIEIDTKHLEGGRCWDINTKDNNCCIKIGIKWNCPEEKEEVVFCGKVVLSSGEYTTSLQKNIAYRSDIKDKK